MRKHTKSRLILPESSEEAQNFTSLPPAPLAFQGDKFLKYFPSLKDQLIAKAPPDIKVVKGGVERTCCLIIVIQLLVAAAYGYFGWVGYQSCKEVRYLSLAEAELCENIKISMNTEYYLDDSGYWVNSRESRGGGSTTTTLGMTLRCNSTKFERKIAALHAKALMISVRSFSRATAARHIRERALLFCRLLRFIVFLYGPSPHSPRPRFTFRPLLFS